MISALRWCIAQSVVISLVALRPSNATTVLLPLVDLEPQYASQLCWAAADVIAVNSFYTSNCLTGNVPGRTSQAVEGGFNLLGVTSLASLTTLQPADVSSAVLDCESNIQFCNQAGNPILPGLTYKKTTNGAALSWTQVKLQIAAGHPFLFQWNYPAGGGSSKPVGLHELVAIGYSDASGNQQLTIWDPWPVPATLPVAVPACGPASSSISIAKLKAAHTVQIDFSVYVDPESDMGVAAAHNGDQFDLAMPVPDAPSNLTIDAVQVPAPPVPKKKRPKSVRHTGVPFEVALKQALPQSVSAAVLKRGQSLGTPFPIIGLGLEDLRAANGDPQVLLTDVTSAVLYPIESKGVVIDSFLLLLNNGKWHRGGYANTEITRLLVQARRDYATKEGLLPATFYLVSVPGRAAFFAAHGMGTQAILIPASSDPSISAIAETPAPAPPLLKNLSTVIRRDDVLSASSAASKPKIP